MTRNKKQSIELLLAVSAIAVLFSLSACSASSPVGTPRPETTPSARVVTLTPFFFASKTAPPSNLPLPSITPLPSPTPTPRTHMVKKGEDMLGIAYQYQITLEELMAANPEVKPNLMSIGTVLVIPGTVESPAGNETPDAHPTPTALPMELGPVFCTPTREGGTWCSQLVHNPHDFALEGLSGVFRLVDQETQAVTSQTGFLPLDLIQPGQSLPLSVFFPPPVPAAYQASAEIISSLPNPQDGRYLPAEIEDQVVTVAENGLSARVSLTLSLDQAETAATRIRAAAIAYDQQGRVIGIRRWERTQDLQFNPGESLSVELTVYSQSGPIQSVETAAEARP